uniref:phosphatidylinositol-3,5-bisphosphate 3-phosphatase n=1 Tax=Gadus morhua TaxID=8049 RepID=A0A8C5CS17_GADMO
MFQLHIICKDSKVVRCHFSTFKQCQEWVKRLNRSVVHPSRLEDLFALAYHAWCLGGSADDEDQHLHLCRPGDHVRHRMEMEVRRMGFDTQNAWRVSDINSNYKLCSSYPQKLLVPVWITDKELESVASFRSWKRIPVVVYRHQKNGAVIARCSQPEISWWGWRNTEDEYLVTSIAKACQMDPGQRPPPGAPGGRPRGEGPDSTDGDFDSSLTGGPGVEDSPAARQKLLILDARSYTAAVANRAKGGGCECEEYYPNCEVMFMGMANIHAIRNSFQALRAVCSQIPDPGNWLSALESTRWLQHLSVMLKAATLVCSGLEREGRPVLVHCSDGWDRTPQIVALAKVLLDPFYRTIEGFQVLVETEWLDYGHKFGDRCGHQENADDVSEQCPVFLQWLDCVHQLIKQFPCLFEFNEAFLVKLVQHTYSCLYGTFLCNNAARGRRNFQNFLYIPSHEMVLQPVCHTRALQLWTAVYLPTTSPCTAVDDAMGLFLSPGAAGDELTPRPLDRYGLVTVYPPSGGLDAPSEVEHSVCRTHRFGSTLLPPSGRAEALPLVGSLTRLSLPGFPRPAPGQPGVGVRERGAPHAHLQRPQPQQALPGGPRRAPLGSGPPESPGDGGSDSEDSEVEAVVRDPHRAPPWSVPRAARRGPPPASPPSPCPPSPSPPSSPTASRSRPPSCSRPCLRATASPSRRSPPRPGLHPRRHRHRPFLRSPSSSPPGPTPASAAPTSTAGPPAPAPPRPPLPGAGRVRGRAPVLLPRGGPRRAPPPQAGWLSALSHAVPGGHTLAAAAAGVSSSLAAHHQLLPAAHPSLPVGPPPTASPPPPQAYLDDDGLPVAMDAVQQRLRQMEACYKQEVELLRQQVRRLQMKLESKQYGSPPSEPDLDYEDDIVSPPSPDSLSSQSEDRLSEGSWDRVDQRDMEVTRWVPDHMASHCFNCDSEFWMAKRRHHCRNCGNVFCKDCCHLKLPIPDQQLYDPVLVCSTCHDQLLECRHRDLRSQQLKKPIATASS